MSKYSFVLYLLILTGCGESTTTIGSADDPVVMVEHDDPEMMAAEQKARDTLDDFIKAMEAPTPTQSDFGIKHAFKDGETYEHMWITGLTYNQGRFTGILGNDPALVKNISNGDPVSIDRSEVEDWLYFDGEEMVGGHTAKLLMSRE